jgi:hypothetical protein
MNESGTSPPQRYLKRRVATVVVVVGLLALGLFVASRFPSESIVSSLPYGIGTSYSDSSIHSVESTSTSSTLSSAYGSTTSEATTSMKTSQLTSTLGTASTTYRTISEMQSSVTGNNVTLACFASLNEVSGVPEVIDGITIYVIHYVNSAGRLVVFYYFPILSATTSPGRVTEFSVVFATNSTFSGVYEYASISGNDSILGVAGISGTQYYQTFPGEASNSTAFDYLVPLESFQPYVLGASNSYSSNQTLTISGALVGSCGESWLSQLVET